MSDAVMNNYDYDSDASVKDIEIMIQKPDQYSTTIHFDSDTSTDGVSDTATGDVVTNNYDHDSDAFVKDVKLMIQIPDQCSTTIHFDSDTSTDGVSCTATGDVVTNNSDDNDVVSFTILRITVTDHDSDTFLKDVKLMIQIPDQCSTTIHFDSDTYIKIKI
ncbi:Hypothetical protein CINCED_3A024308 [Cinara cedri]|uniref:Uncharacterized protein n=1 Tax=Cinara cedri TaxID=506608 RepID=A0A5E4LZJ7_9HEMI|nr:Hypothetical protein CINCED_3A024308 [Cinara cedri]